MEVREEVISPDIARFSSATKRISKNTLTIDLMRRLSLVDQSETITSDDSITYHERRQENDLQNKMKNPKRILIYRKNSDLGEHDSSKNMSDRHWPDFSHSHTIDDDDQDIEDMIDHAVHSASRPLDYHRYNQDINGSDYIHYFRDDSSVKRQEDAVNDHGDVSDKVDNDISDDIGNDIGDDLVSTLNHQSNHGEITFNESNEIFGRFQDANIIGNRNHKTVHNTYIKRNPTNSENSLALNEESNPKISEERFSKPEEMMCSEILSSSRNSTILSPKAAISGQCCKTSDDNERLNEERSLKHSNINGPQKDPTVRPLSDSSNSNTPSLNQNSPDQDSIQVKDIWKALVDGGYDISRDEVSKYKVNSTKPRIRSAPARRRSSQNTTAFARDVPTRAKSAINRDGRDRSKKECFADLNEEDDSESTMKNPKVGAFMQDASETKVAYKKIEKNCI